jgi:hypothetical protein
MHASIYVKGKNIQKHKQTQMPVNYQQSKIYTITNDVNDIFYIGSTAQLRLSSRKSSHNRMSTETTPVRMSPLYVAMRAHGSDHFFITLLHNFPCNDKDQLECEEFRVINDHIANGKQLYNVRVGKNGFKHPDAMKIKIRDTLVAKKCFGENALNGIFNCGSQQLSAGKWKLEWYEQGKKKTKSCTVSKYGFMQAKYMIEDHRRLIYPQWRSDEEVVVRQLCDIDID